MPEEYYDEDGFRLSFESDTDPEEKQYFMRLFPNVSKVAERKIHCTSCQTHIGTAPMSVAIIRMHPVLRVTHCRSCHAFYNSGEFDKGEDGSELYCRWCGQGGEVYCCSNCPYVFCKSCILKNLSRSCVQDIARNENWNCFGCAPKIMWHLRAQHWALMNFIEKQKKDIKMQHDPASIDLLLKQDLTSCCPGKGSSRVKSSLTPSASGSKKPSKRTEGQDNADNVPLSKIRNMGSGVDSSSKKDKSLKPMVIIPPIPPSLLGKEKDSSSSPTPSSKPQKKQKHKNPSTPVDSQEPAQAPPAKKSKKGNNEVVCTPDIMSIFNQMDETRTVPASTSQPSNVSPGVFTIGAPHNMPDNLKAGPPTLTPVSSLQTPGLVSAGTPKPKAILHKSIPRNLLVRLGPVESTSSAALAHANQVAELSSQTVRVPPAGASRQLPNPPVYTTFNGYRIDLHSAAQQGTFRLPNGKLIQVRKATTDSPASTVGSPEMVPGVAFGLPDAAPPVANRTSLTHNPQANMPGFVVRPAAPQQTHQLQQHQQQQQMQHQLQQQSLQHVQPQSMQQQQQQLQPQQQQQPQPQSQQLQQQQQQLTQRQQLQQQILQRQRNRPSQRTKAQKQAQRQQPYQAIVPNQQRSLPVSGIPSTGVPIAPRPNEQQMVQQTAHPSTASSPIQQPILQMLRGLVNAPHPNNSLGSHRKDFEEKLLGCVEACNHIIIKIHTLTQSNSFKAIRNTRDLKELFIHLSYLITYGIGRFNTLHERCVEDVKKMGFTKPSDFVMMGEKINNRNPDDSEDDDDCEIVEENTTVIQVDSDDEAGAGGGRAGPSTSNATVRANPPHASPMPSNTENIVPNATFSGRQSLPNDSTVSSELNETVEERIADSTLQSPEACSSKEPVAGSSQNASPETLQASTSAAENLDKSNKESMESSLAKDTLELSAPSQQETSEPMEVLESIGEKLSNSDQTSTEASLEKETEEGAKQTDITESVELLSDSDEEKQTKSNEVSSDVALEKETAGILKQMEITEPMESLESVGGNMEKAISEPAKEKEVTKKVVSLESEGKDQTKSDQTQLKETIQSTKENTVTEPMEPLESEGEIHAKSDDTLTETSLEKGTLEPTKETAVTEPMKSLESEGEIHSKSVKAPLEKDTNEPRKESEITREPSNSEGESQTKSDHTPMEASLEKETVEPADESEVTEPMESLESEGGIQTSLEKETIEPEGEKEVTEPNESLESKGENQTKSEETPTTEAGVEKETIEPAKAHEITDVMDSSASQEEIHAELDETVMEACSEKGTDTTSCVSNEKTENEASISKEEPPNNSDVVVLDSVSREETILADGSGALQGESMEPMEVSESQGEDPDDFNESFLEDGMEKHPTDDATKISAAELMEVSTSDREHLDNVVANACLDKRVNEDSNASTLGSWESVENLVDDIRGEHVEKCESQTANASERCTKTDESVQPADVISQEKGAEKIIDLKDTILETANEKDVKEDVKTRESSNATFSSSKLNETENSNEEAVEDNSSVSKKLQDSKLDTDNIFHGGSVSLFEDESNDTDLAVVLDDSAKQSSILLDECSNTGDKQEGSSERNANISEEEEFPEKENESDPAKDATVDEVELLSKGGGSVSGVINLMEVPVNTDFNKEGCSELDFFDGESKIPERDSQQTAMEGPDDTFEHSCSESSTVPKDSLHDILLDDLSSISSSSNDADEYTDAVTETAKGSAMQNVDRPVDDGKEIDAEAGQTTSSVVTDDKTGSSSQAQEFSSNTLERPTEEPATIATDRALASRTSFDPQREP
uniref:PHD-type domain-containing protein n=1 Tax=Anopheles atroparvus TaxID=41427 RepID=A0AAG5DXK3_ANOAO